MRKLLVVIVLGCVLAACPGKNKDDGSGSGSDPATKVVDKPITCPPASAIEDGRCVAVVTAENVAAVAQQQTRLDELAKLLDNVEPAAAPIELMNGFRQLDSWKALVAKSDKLKLVDNVVVTLAEGITKLRAFKAGLGETSARLGNLKGELDRVLKEPGTARKIEDVRAQISSQLRQAVEPFVNQTVDTISSAINPLLTQLSDSGDLILGACVLSKLQGGGPKVAELCAQAKGIFAGATKFLEDLKTRPAQLYLDVTAKLKTELATVVDDQTKKLLDATQAQVDQLLKLPTGTSAGSAGAGSAAGAGSTP